MAVRIAEQALLAICPYPAASRGDRKNLTPAPRSRLTRGDGRLDECEFLDGLLLCRLLARWADLGDYLIHFGAGSPDPYPMCFATEQSANVHLLRQSERDKCDLM
jgi:hypothetical protein